MKIGGLLNGWVWSDRTTPTVTVVTLSSPTETITTVDETTKKSTNTGQNTSTATVIMGTLPAPTETVTTIDETKGHLPVPGQILQLPQSPWVSSQHLPKLSPP